MKNIKHKQIEARFGLLMSLGNRASGVCVTTLNSKLEEAKT